MRHFISEGKWRLSPEQFLESLVCLYQLPKGAKEIPGLIGYYRLWIDWYTLETKGIYLKLLDKESDLLFWKSEELQSLDPLKQSLTTAPVLALPSLEKPFHLFVSVDKETALVVLTQDHGGQRQPVAFLSKILDPVSREWPECIQSVAVTVILTEESRKLTFGGYLIISTPHQGEWSLTRK
jgi:hypothetical protein